MNCCKIGISLVVFSFFGFIFPSQSYGIVGRPDRSSRPTVNCPETEPVSGTGDCDDLSSQCIIPPGSGYVCSPGFRTTVGSDTVCYTCNLPCQFTNLGNGQRGCENPHAPYVPYEEMELSSSTSLD